MKKLLSTICAALLTMAAGGWASMVPAHAASTVNCAGLDAALAINGNDIILDNGGVPCTGAHTITTGNQVTLTGKTQADGFDGATTNLSLQGSNNGATVIRNLTFKNGNPALQLTGTVSPTVANSIFLGNAGTDGGGFTTTASGDVTLTGNIFGSASQPNTGSGNGGAAGLRGDHLTITNNQFLSNRLSNTNIGNAGGGIAAFSASTDTNSVVFSGNVLVGNSTAGSGGGGAYLNTRGGMTVTGNTFRGNFIDFPAFTSSGEKGGGLSIFEGSGGTVNQSHNIFDSNVIHAGTTIIHAQPRSSNPNDFGGAGEFIVGPSTVSLDDTYTRNQVETNPGVDTPIGGGLAVQGTTSVGNATNVTTVSTLTAYNMVAVNNSVGDKGEGGGVYAGGLQAPSGCQAVPCTATANIFDSTISNNTVGAAGVGPEIKGDTGDTLHLANDIVTGPVGSQTDVAGFTTFTVNHSDICDAGVPVAGSGNICAEPRLANVAANDVHETSASPTVDTGDSAQVPNALTQDYYGVTRIQGRAVDMGAAEVPVPAPALPLAGATSTLSQSVATWLSVFGLALVAMLASGMTAMRFWARRRS